MRLTAMRHFAFAAVLFALAGQTTAQQPEPKKKTDLELLQGSWEIVGLEAGGKAEPAQNYRGNTFAFTRNKGTDVAILREGIYPLEFTFTLDPAKTPKAIDLTTKGNTARGIYKLDGDDLVVCVSIGGSQRPTEFATKAGGDTETFTLKRSKWERYSDKAFGFSVEFPGKPAESKRDETTTYTFRSEMDRVSYAASVTPLPGRLDAKGAEAALDAAQQAAVAEAEKTAKAKVESEGKLNKPPPGVWASREVTISMEMTESKDKGAMRVRMFVAADRLYTLTVTGAEEGTKSPSAARFLGSFRPPNEKKDPPSKQ